MKHPIGRVAAILVALVACGSTSAQETAKGTLIDRDGREIGSVTLSQLPSGVLVRAQARGLGAGAHGFHLHETGKCEPDEGFATAGGHLADGRAHGFEMPAGPHPGDMPNAHVQDDGVLEVEVLNPRVRLGSGGEGTPLLDDDGAALVIHAGPDDYASQPSGAAGERVACAVLKRDG